jgi:hypothetical protein
MQEKAPKRKPKLRKMDKLIANVYLMVAQQSLMHARDILRYDYDKEINGFYNRILELRRKLNPDLFK